jgi:hypothetical protein
MKRTGDERKKPPPYFQELHDILGSKHKAIPQHLQDSISLEDSSTARGPSTSQEKKNTKNRFFPLLVSETFIIDSPTDPRSRISLPRLIKNFIINLGE